MHGWWAATAVSAITRPAPGQHKAEEWAEVVPRMDLLMEVTARFGDRSRPIERPSPDERGGLLAYLERHALRPLAADHEAPLAYRALCGDCHAATRPGGLCRGGLAGPPGTDGWASRRHASPGGRCVGAGPGRSLSRGSGRGPASPCADGTGADRLAKGIPLQTLGPRPLACLALGPVFALVLLGLARWWLRQRRRA